MLTIEEIYPPFGLRVEAADLEMRVLRDDDLPELVELVRGGIEQPGLPMPFLSDWHRRPWAPGTPDGFPTTSLSWWWTQRATCSPASWQLPLVVRRAGVLVGMQDMNATDFAQARHVETGSWLGLAHQGSGTGTLMRALAVVLAVDELGALTCGSGYLLGNHASAAVSRKVGYADNGRQTVVQRVGGERVAAEVQRVVVTPQTLVRPDVPVTVEGAEALRRFLGVQR